MSGASYDDLYKSRTWAYGDRPDSEFIKALVGVPRGKALDVGGGQGRHAIAMSALGFNVTLVDHSTEGLHQASSIAEERGLPLHTIQGDVSKFQSDDEYQVICAALFFQQLTSRSALQLAKKLGTWLTSSGLFYVSVPGFNKETEALAGSLLEEAGCKTEWINKYLVTKRDRPNLGIPRRNETHALGKALRRR